MEYDEKLARFRQGHLNPFDKAPLQNRQEQKTAGAGEGFPQKGELSSSSLSPWEGLGSTGSSLDPGGFSFLFLKDWVNTPWKPEGRISLAKGSPSTSAFGVAPSQYPAAGTEDRLCLKIPKLPWQP